MANSGKRVEQLSDEELVEVVRRSSDAASFGVLYDRYAGKVYSKCMGLTRDRDQAKDLTHDIFLKAFLNMGKFDGRSGFGTWLYRITFNYCMDHLRRKKKGDRQADENLPELMDESAFEQELLRMQADQLNVVLEHIDAADRALLLFKYQEEMSIKDMAELLEMGESAVKMRLLRARERALAMYHQLYPEHR
ncbi:MAG: sigma-70 family RNA polymerase sigma factor [Flavobacteriales bacterium]|nr:sigma-70 family RNA polymerase sigma factor [Flavobacteriales bacterium]